MTQTCAVPSSLLATVRSRECQSPILYSSIACLGLDSSCISHFCLHDLVDQFQGTVVEKGLTWYVRRKERAISSRMKGATLSVRTEIASKCALVQTTVIETHTRKI